LSYVVRAPARELRGDERKLYTRVRQTLWDYEPLRASHAEIFIDVDGWHVGLTGRVRTLPQKTIAEALVRRLPNVEAVTNALIADREVVMAVAEALAQDERTAPYVIRVEARHGVVTLRGDVPSDVTRRAAVELASGVETVAEVREALAIGGPEYAPVALARRSDAPQLEAEAETEPEPVAPAQV
jgi:osmotically-inducible protein OsmY